MTIEQLSFWQDEPVEPPTSAHHPAMPRAELKQRVLAYLAALKPDAIALNVPVRRSKFTVGAACAFIEPRGKAHHNCVTKTIAIEIFNDRVDCLPDYSNNSASYSRLRTMEQEKSELEAAIRRDEPELRGGCDLFPDDDFAEYDYRASRKYPYMRLLRRIERTRHAIFRGSRLENIRRANAADYLYLAVPQGAIEQHELAPGWGLLEITPELEVIERSAAPDLSDNVSAAGRNHLALNIARAAIGNVLFANGILHDAQEITVYPTPRRRRKVKYKL